mmetsp:Transcript_44737/g.103470  ORF Transcript_44737/g.103470 Transcript_44737/m.103470 type:complete len:258 (-) Transcript_44737:142-915(-)
MDQVLGKSSSVPLMAGNMPKQGVPRQLGCIAGYTGHVAGKAAENIHGGTFHSENLQASQHELPLRELRRTGSLTEYHKTGTHLQGLSRTSSMKRPPKVPGYMGHIPGKEAESVHGTVFGDGNQLAQTLRTNNPVVSCDGWLKRGGWPCDRMATYKFAGRVGRGDLGSLFTQQQEEEAMAANVRMGHKFGLRPPAPNPFRPGDRFLHVLHEKAPRPQRQDASDCRMAGQASHSSFLDGERWKIHNSLIAMTGHMRTPF